jgi:hypothetical protein
VKGDLSRRRPMAMARETYGIENPDDTQMQLF